MGDCGRHSCCSRNDNRSNCTGKCSRCAKTADLVQGWACRETGEKEVSGSRYQVSVPNRRPTQAGAHESMRYTGLRGGLTPDT